MKYANSRKSGHARALMVMPMATRHDHRPGRAMGVQDIAPQTDRMVAAVSTASGRPVRLKSRRISITP